MLVPAYKADLMKHTGSIHLEISSVRPRACVFSSFACHFEIKWNDIMLFRRFLRKPRKRAYVITTTLHNVSWSKDV